LKINHFSLPGRDAVIILSGLRYITLIMGKQIHRFEVSDFEASLCQKYLSWHNVLGDENWYVFV